MLNIAILGASGYTGAELIRLLAVHEHANIVALTGDSQAGKPFADVYPHLAHLKLPKLMKIDEVDFSKIDLVFCCLPHGTTQDVIAGLPENCTVIDLSADFRLFNVDTYAEWYGHAHRAPDLQHDVVYGLSEIYRDQIKKARIIANPGCYPTSVLLPLIPLIRAGMIDPASIIIDAKSGVSGAGRAAKQQNLFAEIDGSVSAYGVGHHRHMPEIEQELSKAAGRDTKITFTPHLMPMSRGMLSTIYVKCTKDHDAASLKECLHTYYDGAAFVSLTPEGVFPATAHVRGTNRCVIGVYPDRIQGRAIIVSVIDNLGKGASSQAVQNMNIRFGFDERTALAQPALVP